ncbi:hypothetical protein AAHK20_04500 [Trinickia sp. YCB016]
MGMKLALGVSMALVSLTGALQSASALADGPKSAYENGGVTNASLDPGEEQMTADEENTARLKDLSDAYHNGYNARAKEDAETYSSLRDQLKHPPQQTSAQLMPPLPEGVPPGEGNAQVKPVQRTQVAQRALPPQPQEQAQYQQPQPQYQQAYQQPQYAPPPQAPRYQPAPQYAAPPAYEEVTQEYQEPAYQEAAYAPPPPPPPQTYQYVPVYTQAAYVPQPPVQVAMQPVVTIARPVAYPVYQSAYWAPRYRRAYTVRYAYPAQQMAGYGGWE